MDLFKKILMFLFSLKFTNAGVFCISERFNPRCNKKEIINVQKAFFGRKDVNRCLVDEELTKTNEKDPKFIGCYSDVRHVLQPQCAGNQSCDVWVASVSTPTSCYNYLKQHLNVHYNCIPGKLPFYHFHISIMNKILFFIYEINWIQF